MKSRSQLLATALTLTILVVAGAAAQVISQPTPVPLVTADSERWFLDGDPITYAGNLYYPAGAQVAFNPNEMIRSGFHLGVPLYARTTDEPFSIVYVPVARGFVQPYARRRTGDVVGTAGTSPLTGVAAAYSPAGGTVPIYQAAGPPTHVAGPPADASGLPRGVIPAVPRTEAAPSGTAGAAVSPSMPPTQPEAAPATPMRTRIGPPPTGLNAVFVQFRDHRWIGEGRTVPLDRSSMIEAGDLGGFPVFTDRDAPEQRIYVAIAKDALLLAAYRR